MAKVVFKRTPHSAYEFAVVEGGETMKDYERAALLDDFIAKHGLVPVETTFMGEVPSHKYGRYTAGVAAASALPPPALPGREDDLVKANAENDNLRAELARLQAQLDKQPASKQAAVIDVPEIIPPAPLLVGSSGGGAQSTEDARATLNQQDGVNIVPSSEEVREDMSTADRSDENPKVDTKETPAKTRGRPKKAD